ncbi:MAG: hypothetical protein RBU21_19810 [FCB group bacterium]|jgi:hypothetical protein|nr:hypothetical protein [FCB group bacterium]
MKAVGQALRFVWSHWVHVLLCVPMLVGVTVIHELAHAAAVLLQGGSVTRISVWPSGGSWGSIYWLHPKIGPAHSSWVSLAPYILWLALAAVAACVALAPRRKPFWLASTVFVWCYAVPVLDVANAVAGYAYDAGGDLGAVFGASLTERVAIAALSGIVLCGAGFPVQRGLYGKRALGLGGYALLSALAVAAMVALPHLVL